MGCILKSVVNGSDPAAAFAGVLAQSNALLSIGKSNGLRHQLCGWAAAAVPKPTRRASRWENTRSCKLSQEGPWVSSDQICRAAHICSPAPQRPLQCLNRVVWRVV